MEIFPEVSVARALRMCGPLRKLELFKFKLQGLVPVAVVQTPLSSLTSTFCTATLSADVPEIGRFAEITALLAGVTSVTVGGVTSATPVLV